MPRFRQPGGSRDEFSTAIQEYRVFFFSETKRLAKQILGRETRFGDPSAGVLPGARQNMIKFVGKNPGYRLSESRISAGFRSGYKILPEQQANAFAVNINERLDFAIADVRPAKRPRITPFRPEALGIAFALEMNHGQLRRDMPPGFGHGKPVEPKAGGYHDCIEFIPHRIHYGYRGPLLEVRVQRNRDGRRWPTAPERWQYAQP